jgi:hypothetical protein
VDIRAFELLIAWSLILRKLRRARFLHCSWAATVDYIFCERTGTGRSQRKSGKKCPTTQSILLNESSGPWQRRSSAEALPLRPDLVMRAIAFSEGCNAQALPQSNATNRER